MSSVNINETQGFSLLSAVLVECLQRFGWSMGDIEAARQELYAGSCLAAEEAVSPIRERVDAVVAALDPDENTVQAIIQMEYAVRGLDLAIDFERRRAALCN